MQKCRLRPIINVFMYKHYRTSSTAAVILLFAMSVAQSVLPLANVKCIVLTTCPWRMASCVCVCVCMLGITTLAASSTKLTASASSISSRISHRKYSTRLRAQRHTCSRIDVIVDHMTSRMDSPAVQSRQIACRSKYTDRNRLMAEYFHSGSVSLPSVFLVPDAKRFPRRVYLV